MPHWNCERCGARLYSASKSLRRNNCPVCQGRLSPRGDVRSGRFEQGKPMSIDLSGTSPAEQQADVTRQPLTPPSGHSRELSRSKLSHRVTLCP